MLVKKLVTGSSVDVIDSYSGSGAEAVVVTYTKASTPKTASLKAEEHFDVRTDGNEKGNPTKLDLGKIFQDDTFVRKNTKEDLVYMEKLENTLKSKAETNEQMKPALLKVQ